MELYFEIKELRNALQSHKDLLVRKDSEIAALEERVVKLEDEMQVIREQLKRNALLGRLK